MHRRFWKNFLRSMSKLETNLDETFDETETIEKEVQKSIETGQNAIKVRASKTVNTNKSLWENTTDSDEQPTRRYQENENHGNHGDRNRFLKPLSPMVTSESLKISGSSSEV